jgi:hypothetical protein
MGPAASHLIQGMLYAVHPSDPETYAVIILLVLVVAAIASAGPALRAATTDPAKVLARGMIDQRLYAIPASAITPETTSPESIKPPTTACSQPLADTTWQPG